MDAEMNRLIQHVLDEVDGRRGTACSSDLPETSWWFPEDGPFPTVPSRTVQATFVAYGSPGRWLHRYWAVATSIAPVGFCPSSPATLHPVLGIAPGIGLLRSLCHHEGRPLEVVPSSHVYTGPSLGALFAGFPSPSEGSRSVVAPIRRVPLRPGHSACPIVPCMALTGNFGRIAPLGFEQFSSHHRRRSLANTT
jgi:hypothetical protein